MSAQPRTGAEQLAAVLERAGISCVFGVPGTQNVTLFDALRRSRVRTVLAASEVGAAFMAAAFARAAGGIGVFVTIPGPGFAYALAGLAEARADSAAVVHVTGLPAKAPGKRFQLQAIDQAAIAGPVVKRVIDVAHRDEVVGGLWEALTTARAGEPGPVLLQLAGDVLNAAAADDAAPPPQSGPHSPDLIELVALLTRARRPVVLLGQGARGSASELQEFVTARRIPVITTPSGRGCLPEDHPLSFGFDALRQDVAEANALLRECDLVLALGCKLGHNGTAGFRLELPADRLVHVDASSDVLNANYPARLALCAHVADVLPALTAAPAAAVTWTDAELATWRQRMRAVRPPDLPEPELPAGFFAALRRALPRDAMVVTDSGMHQILARRYLDVLAPGGLLFPSDFQSMGFGVPGAIGAALAAPARRVVALVGDGGLRMTGMELTTAVRERVPLPTIVFNDGQLNQIRLQQLAEFGQPHAVALGPLDLEQFASAVGMSYVALGRDVDAGIATALAAAGPTLLDVPVGDSTAIHATRAKSVLRGTARGLLGPRLLRWLKRWR